jgi:hypothetical protein
MGMINGAGRKYSGIFPPSGKYFQPNMYQVWWVEENLAVV